MSHLSLVEANDGDVIPDLERNDDRSMVGHNTVPRVQEGNDKEEDYDLTDGNKDVRRSERTKKLTERGMKYQFSLLDEKRTKLTSRLSRICKCIDSLLYSDKNKVTVREELNVYNDTFKLLCDVHNKMYMLDENYNEGIWFNDIDEQVFSFKHKIHNWLKEAENDENESRRSTRSKRSSSSRSRSTNTSRRRTKDMAIEAKVKVAELLAEASYKDKIRAAEEQAEKLKMEEQVAKAQAKVKLLEEYEKNNGSLEELSFENEFNYCKDPAFNLGECGKNNFSLPINRSNGVFNPQYLSDHELKCNTLKKQVYRLDDLPDKRNQNAQKVMKNYNDKMEEIFKEQTGEFNKDVGKKSIMKDYASSERHRKERSISEQYGNERYADAVYGYENETIYGDGNMTVKNMVLKAMLMQEGSQSYKVIMFISCILSMKVCYSILMLKLLMYYANCLNNNLLLKLTWTQLMGIL